MNAIHFLLRARCFASPSGCKPFLVALLVLALPVASAGAARLFESTNVFLSSYTHPESPDGYPFFRIPSLITAPNGDLLAFAEGRYGFDDAGGGRIGVVTKRSTDRGRTWSGIESLASNGLGDVTNPTALVDHDPLAGSDTVWLFYNKWPQGTGELNVPPGTGPDSSSLWTRSSIDNGLTWSAERELTDSFKQADWCIASAGPGRGIQTAWGRPGAPAGRLVVPGWRTSSTSPGSASFLLYSDDHGGTWQLGGVTEALTNEAQLVELIDGTLLLDARQNESIGSRSRLQFRSEDGGQTLSGPEPGLEVTEVMTSILRYSAVRDGDDLDRLLYSAPSADGRFGLRVFLSYDEGATWTNETRIDPGSSAYSSLTVLDDGTIGLLYEPTYFETRFVRFNLEFLGETPVPEPGSIVLLAGGLAALGLRARRRPGDAAKGL